MMRWKVHSERTLYQDPWVHVLSADVELPDGRHLDHRLIRTPRPGAGAAVVDLVLQPHLALAESSLVVADTGTVLVSTSPS
jgi:hypothetical protein